MNDTRVEGDETLAVRLLVTGPNVMVFRDSANITIIDDDCKFVTLAYSCNAMKWYTWFVMLASCSGSERACHLHLWV